jgi:hypothetical protein
VRSAIFYSERQTKEEDQEGEEEGGGRVGRKHMPEHGEKERTTVTTTTATNTTMGHMMAEQRLVIVQAVCPRKKHTALRPRYTLTYTIFTRIRTGTPSRMYIKYWLTETKIHT